MSSGNDFISPWKLDGVQFWSIDYIQAPREKVLAYLTRAEHTRRHYFGWPMILGGLKTLIETGKPLTWPPPATGEADHD